MTELAYHVLCTTHKAWVPTEEEAKNLNKRAEELWPDNLPFSSSNRERWKKAIELAKNTSSGWVLDPKSGPRTYY